MLIGFFKSDHPRAIFVLPVVIVGFWIFPCLNLQPIPDTVNMPLYELIISLLGNSYVSVVVAMLLLFVEALLLNRVVMSRKVFSKKSYLPALLYIVLMSSFPVMLYLNPVIIANLFLILALGKMFNIDKESDFFSDIFDASVLIGIATIIYLPSIILILFVLYCLFFIRRSDMKEKLIAMVGLVVPFAYVFAYYFWFDGVERLWTEQVVNPVFSKQSFHIYEYQFYLPLILLVLLTILSFRKLYHGLANSSIATKRILSVLIGFFVFSGVSVLLVQSYSIENLLFLAIPLSIYFTNFFVFTQRKWLAELFFVLLTGTLIYNHISGI